MTASSLAVQDEDLALVTDLYQLTMLQAYFKEDMDERGVFSLYFRRLPDSRNFMLACGQQYAAGLATRVRFSQAGLDRLAATGRFDHDFLAWLKDYRFSGDIWTLPEGTPVFPNEPLMEVEAPIAEAQLLESLIMNQVQVETTLASKAVRLVIAARGRQVVDFGLRRMHGVDAAMRGVRAYRAAGLDGTSNVLGGLRHDLTLSGTMAHSYVLAHNDEMEAFRQFAKLYPGTTLLVDTYDTLAGVDKVIELMEGPDAIQVGAVRLDSGDLGELARGSRERLDAACFEQVKIVASSSLDEYKIAELLANDAPIDVFGVGTALGVSTDAPVTDLSYKLVEYAGKPCVKNSPGKVNLPYRKQVYRFRDIQGRYQRDLVSRREESVGEGEALLAPMVKAGEILEDSLADLETIRQRVSQSIEDLPPDLRRLEAAATPYPVSLSDELKRWQQD
ncbi:nicotinate phosphoribosyltransferase [Pistricoccus aurantiacus]|uniref:Nicotinate phosphoribosyltransferase n=1 Tax=Pistricoccus aurantiacus TaxID=1883414 RepID=A0A5B8SYQ3_9GAMM|nr:nicotinate phosphoribosyltransferase [Pistricoccus aurantiacus]QEA40655.1 nicotinate phosphoribosyltransferase [Pistricoccus aurantiacus]